MGSFETWVEIPVTVHYDFQPAEKMTRHYPGCPAAVCVNALEFDGEEVSDKMLNYILKKFGESLEDECWEDSEPETV